MKPTSQEPTAVNMPPELLAEASKAASEEHRPTDELASDAVRRYLRQRSPAETPAPPPAKAKRTLLDLLEPLRGLDIEFTRNRSDDRPVEL